MQRGCEKVDVGRKWVSRARRCRALEGVVVRWWIKGAISWTGDCIVGWCWRGRAGDVEENLHVSW